MDYPRPCVRCGVHTDYDMHVKSGYPLPTPHCLLCSVVLEKEVRERIKDKQEEQRK